MAYFTMPSAGFMRAVAVAVCVPLLWAQGAAAETAVSRTSLITALQGYHMEGSTSFAFAPEVDINQQVQPQDDLAAMLGSVGLQSRRVGAVTYIEPQTTPVAAAAPVVAPEPDQEPVKEQAARSSVTGEVVLASSTNEAAPLQEVAPPVVATQAPPPLLPPLAPAPAAERHAEAAPTPEAAAQVVPASAPTVLVPPSPAQPQAVLTPPPAAPVVIAPAAVEAPATVVAVEPSAAPVPAAEPAAAAPAEAAPAPVADAIPAHVAAAVDAANDSITMESPVGVASPVVDPVVKKADSWTAERGQTLRDVLDAWCNRANVQMVWSSEFDYPLAASIAVNDSFENAVRTLLVGLSGASPQPVAKLHRQGGAGGSVLIVTTRGNTYQDR